MMSDEISAKDIRANSSEEIFHVVNWEVGEEDACLRGAFIIYWTC